MKVVSLFQAGFLPSMFSGLSRNSAARMCTAMTASSGEINDSSEPSSKLSTLLPPLEKSNRRIYLLRHGQTDWNKNGKMQGGGFDIELNDTGRKQAQLVSNELAGIPLGIIASSHLKRAHETADICCTRHPGAKRLVFPEFGEMRFGDFEGLAIRGPDATEKTRAQFKEFNDKMLGDINVRCPGGGESTAEVAARGRKGIQQILEEYPEEGHIAIVAHGRTNKVILASLIYDSALKYYDIAQGNTCINVLDLSSDGKWTSRVLNYVDHYESSIPAPPV